MTKTPFITADKLEQITAEFPTPFHLYDEKGIRETARAVNMLESSPEAKFFNESSMRLYLCCEFFFPLAVV